MNGELGIGFLNLGASTPRLILEDLSWKAETLANRSGAQGNKFGGSLHAASGSIEKGNSRAAIQQLKAFINKIDAMVRSGRLTKVAGAILTQEANSLIQTIQAS